MKRLFMFLVFLAVIALPCQAQEKPKDVIVANAAGNPVPVTVVSDTSNEVLVTLLDNAVPSSETYILDVRQYRTVSILGTAPAPQPDSYGGQTYKLEITFLDTITPGQDYQLRSRIWAGHATLFGLNGPTYAEPGISINLPIPVAGPFLEVRIFRESGAPMGTMTVKVHLQK